MKPLPAMVLARLERDLLRDDDNTPPLHRMIVEDYLEGQEVRLETGRRQLALAKQVMDQMSLGLDHKAAVNQVHANNYVDHSTIARAYREFTTNGQYWAAIQGDLTP